ncbi:putative GNAT family acetyltransferase [Aspergillus undulatus]|uniref:putative GNAT family acetyltransferase n=1 Tax=Aspergillus undulatus TaxID=1810928 RepID=UPI003CCE11F7
MQSRYQLHIINPQNDPSFPELMKVLWESFETPYQGLLRLFFPILDNDRAKSLESCIAGQIEEYTQSQPSLIWVAVVDTHAEGRIVAGAKWFFYDEDPHPHSNAEEEIVADWFPEGTIAREFATQTVRLFEKPRLRLAKGPHAFLHIAFTHPTHRGMGLSTLFMEWGLRRADEKGLQTWLDASEFGRPVYERWGFTNVLSNPVIPVLDPQREADMSLEEREEWRVCERVMLPIEYTLMVRDRKGVVVGRGDEVEGEKSSGLGVIKVEEVEPIV